jgi:tRNA A-37 threonylcarbamoyl transferase component Bud32
MKADSQLPSFEGAAEWVNAAVTAPLPKGRPLLVHFWSISSDISTANLKHLAELRDRRKREGLRLIAVHLPLRAEEREPDVVKESASQLNLTEPCALDNFHAVRDVFFETADDVPAYFLFDIEHRLKSSSSGENGLTDVEDELATMIDELREQNPFCPQCELFLNEGALFCSDCGLPLNLPRSEGAHPYYEKHIVAAMPTMRLVNPDPLIGQKIEGKYELIARIGEGGLSHVYRARRIHIGDEVAVKIMRREFAGDEAARARFRREASAAAMLRHPNIITIYDFAETDSDRIPAYIVMDLINGAPLRELLNSGPFAVERAERLMRGICAGIAAAHKRGVIHRDLKPDNVLVMAPDDISDFESVRIVDFGFAKLVTDAAAGEKGTVVGTPFYMSPEQCLGQPLDSRSDVYSLGATFYEILSGKPPFASERVSGIINKHLYDEPPPLPLDLKIPRRISVGIARAMAKDPDDRPQTAAELARVMQLG